MYFQISILRDLIYGATAHGADFNTLCKGLNITPALLNNGEGHIKWEPGETEDFWTMAVEMTGDQCLGLHMGLTTTDSTFGMLGYLAKSCKTLGEALATICKYNDTVSGVFKYSLDLSGKDAVMHFDPIPLWEAHNLESARQGVDMSLSSFARSFYMCTGKNIRPLMTELRYSKRHVEEYEKVLKSIVRFNATRNCFILSKEDLNTPLLSYDESLFSLFNSLLLQKQEVLNQQKTIAEKIRLELLSNFKGQVPPIEILASRLCMTTRTLQRKLSEEKTSYRAICNQLRKELAEELMVSGRSKKGDVAALLGYADAGTFRKAFRSWISLDPSF